MKRSTKNKALITGASGLLGLELVRCAVKNGYNVVGVYNANPDLTDKNYRNLKCDIGDIGSVNFLDKKVGKIDAIFHCASMTGIDKCENSREVCWQANVVGTRNMVELAKKHRAKLIYISTGSVFFGEKGNYKENDTPDPKNFYSWTKLLGEEAVLAYDKGIVIRVVPIGIHSIGRPQANFIEWLVDSVNKNKSFNLFNDVYINAISAKTFAGILLKIPKVFKKGVLHIGSRDRLSKAEIGQAVISKFPNFSGEAKLISVESMPGNFAARPKEMWLNTNKAVKLGLKMPGLKDELELILEVIAKK
ncbi:MAG: SDR family oxidoreductase [Candidatus Yanofskybacteria bacterium]|nr:SDR family oxidoreductase [Candidatus Yanofskybacteria bacterium]